MRDVRGVGRRDRVRDARHELRRLGHTPAVAEREHRAQRSPFDVLHRDQVDVADRLERVERDQVGVTDARRAAGLTLERGPHRPDPLRRVHGGGAHDAQHDGTVELLIGRAQDVAQAVTPELAQHAVMRDPSRLSVHFDRIRAYGVIVMAAEPLFPSAVATRTTDPTCVPVKLVEFPDVGLIVPCPRLPAGISSVHTIERLLRGVSSAAYRVAPNVWLPLTVRIAVGGVTSTRATGLSTLTVTPALTPSTAAVTSA